jgi:hypothetical protein
MMSFCFGGNGWKAPTNETGFVQIENFVVTIHSKFTRVNKSDNISNFIFNYQDTVCCMSLDGLDS